MPSTYPNKPAKRSDKYIAEELNKRLKWSLIGIFAFISVGLILINFFGPQIGGLFGFISINRNQENPTPSKAISVPSFSELPKATNQDSISVSGYSATGTTVKLFVNGPEVGSSPAGEDGKFMFENIPLISNRNTIYAKAVDGDGNESEKSETYIITVDKEKPKLEVSQPNNGEKIKNLDERVLVKGKVNEKAKITINEKLVVQKPDLSFEYLLGVSEGDVKISIKAEDEAGNSKTEVLEIKYDKDSN